LTDGAFDVAIIGGGPAGSAAALTLLRYSKLRVVVIERSEYDGWRVGETLSPGVQPLLRYLDASSVTEGDAHLTNYGTAASWGGADTVSRDFLFVAAGEGRHLDRARFDRALAALVRERGGTLLTGCVVESEERRGQSAEDRGESADRSSNDPAHCALRSALWTLSLNNGRTIDAHFVIDASGRHAAFARRRGARVIAHDNLMGLVAIVAGKHAYDGGTLIEATPDGWWYSARLPDDRTVVAFMSDIDVIREQHLHETSEWLRLLDQTNATRARIGDAEILREPAACPAQSQMLEPPFGDGWIAAGESAVAFDPLSSMGIGYALTSGIEAARFAAAGIRADTYTADIASHFNAYLKRRREYYCIEQRWSDRAFWRRRQAADTFETASAPRLANLSS
jgi:flavin-dependent dehydrogenase